MTTPGGGTDTTLRSLLKYNKLEPDKDVTILYLGGVTQQIAALQAKSADGVFNSEPMEALARPQEDARGARRRGKISQSRISESRRQAPRRDHQPRESVVPPRHLTRCDQESQLDAQDCRNHQAGRQVRGRRRRIRIPSLLGLRQVDSSRRSTGRVKRLASQNGSSMAAFAPHCHESAAKLRISVD
ncbi:MAG: hypothetical protein HY329_18315 [Chloroflexi bacterium]|nr:hypothetical protein [Chloroflexota bacterium]